MTTTPARPAASQEDEYLGEHHVFAPHRAGLPNLGRYLRELWRRREFATELSRSTMRAAHTRTALGQLWLVVNPLLLAVVYFVLVDLLAGGDRGVEYFAHLLAGLFAFYFVAGSITTGGQSVVGGGKLIMNTAFPRLLLPLSAVRTAFLRFVPTLAVYAVIHLVAGLPLRPVLLLALLQLGLIGLFCIGMACLFGVLQVYFRDISSFLPYVLRIWLYLSPVLLTVEQITGRLEELGYGWAAFLNPLLPLLGGWSILLTDGRAPSAAFWVASAVWSLGACLAGALFFISREREFAVRL